MDIVLSKPKVSSIPLKIEESNKNEPLNDSKQIENFTLFNFILNTTKINLLFNEFISLFLWIAILNLFFIFSTFLLLLARSDLIFFLLQMIHLPLTVMSFLIIKSIPRPYQIYNLFSNITEIKIIQIQKIVRIH